MIAKHNGNYYSPGGTPLKASEGKHDDEIQNYTRMENNSSLPTDREVFFRCGNWCYKGLIQFNDLQVSTADLPLLIPVLQRQQASLRYYCNSKSVPDDSEYNLPMKFLYDMTDFISTQLVSEDVERELNKMSSLFTWIKEDSANTYFELTLTDVPEYMNSIALIASKTYTRGLIIVSIYHDGSVYFVLNDGEGDQHLLDVRFPNVCNHGQGLHLKVYNEGRDCWKKLTLWHVVGDTNLAKKTYPKIKTISVANQQYEQTYCILKSTWDENTPILSVHHDVLFRFGSWCYSGRVQLTEQIKLMDIPYVIPALRMQQNRLEYLCDVNHVPTTSPFAGALEYMQQIAPKIGDHIVNSEETLKSLIDRLNSMGLGESVSNWLEGDSSNSFFEFKIHPDNELINRFKNVELVVSKSYYASGIITITIVFQHNIYVTVLDSKGENPLLDSKFPDVSGKGRGYQLDNFGDDGHEDWSNLKTVYIWQTISALETEFRQKAIEHAESKKSNDKYFDEENGYSSDDVKNNSEKQTLKSSRVIDEYDDNSRSPTCRVEWHGNSKKRKDNVNNENNSNDHSAKGEPESTSNTRLPARAEEKLSPLTISQSSNNTGHRDSALPHHIAKDATLSKKMEELRTKN